MIRRISVLALGLLAAGGAAAGEPAPFAAPQVDVDITYALPGTAGLTQRLRVQAATGLQRIDPPTPGSWIVTDGRSGRLMVVQPALHQVTRLPPQAAPLPPVGTRATGLYTRVGTDRIAGNDCTDWSTADQTGQQSVVCLTEDGMLLRIAQAGIVRAQAVSVQRATQPDAVFAAPAGFKEGRALPIDPLHGSIAKG